MLAPDSLILFLASQKLHQETRLDVNIRSLMLFTMLTGLLRIRLLIRLSQSVGFDQVTSKRVTKHHDTCCNRVRVNIILFQIIIYFRTSEYTCMHSTAEIRHTY